MSLYYNGFAGQNVGFIPKSLRTLVPKRTYTSFFEPTYMSEEKDAQDPGSSLNIRLMNILDSTDEQDIAVRLR